MLIFNHRTYKWVLPHLPFVYEIHFLFKKRIGLHCVSVLISRINFFPFTKMKTQKNWVYDEKNIYSSPVYGIVCLYNRLWRHSQARVKRFLTVTPRAAWRQSLQKQHPMNIRDKKISVFNVRVDNCMKSERHWHQRAPASCELHYGRLWPLALVDTVHEMPGWVVQDSERCSKSNTMFGIILPAPNVMQQHDSNIKEVHLVLLL